MNKVTITAGESTYVIESESLPDMFALMHFAELECSQQYRVLHPPVEDFTSEEINAREAEEEMLLMCPFCKTRNLERQEPGNHEPSLCNRCTFGRL